MSSPKLTRKTTKYNTLSNTQCYQIEAKYTKLKTVVVANLRPL